MEPATTALPRPADLPPVLRAFLNEHLPDPDDLSRSPALAAEVARKCRGLDAELAGLMKRLSASVQRWEARSEEAREVLRKVVLDLGDLGLLQSPGNDGVDLVKIQRILGIELPTLTKHLRRIKLVRFYGGTTLCLEALVGDLEDAALSYMSQNTSRAITPTDFESNQENLLIAIQATTSIEDVLSNVAKYQPSWVRLLTVVDSRVEKILAMIRSQALGEYRAILVSLGWPPPLTSNMKKESCPASINPLVLVQGDKRENFSKYFLRLCAIQHLQACRKARQHNFFIHQKGFEPDFVKMNDTFFLDDILWGIDELVIALAPRTEHHFSRWSTDPKFIFALVYKITQDFLEGIDNVLQPLIDKARLVGYSAKEAWVAAMLKMLSTYSRNKLFSYLAKRYDADIGRSEVMSSWLHLVDLVIAFDKQMAALSSSRMLLKESLSEFCGLSLPTLLSSIFQDHLNWLLIWAEIELKDAEEKLKAEIEDEKSWKMDIKQEDEFINEKDDKFFLSTRDDYKTPPIAELVIKISCAMKERCLALSDISLRLQFIKSTVCILMDWFFVVLSQRCEDIDLSTMIMEEEVLLRVTSSINAAHYCESVMQDWSEDIIFIEMAIADKDANSRTRDDIDVKYTLFHDIIKNMVKLETDCLADILSSLLLEFESSTQNYIQNNKRWESELDILEADAVLNKENLSISSEFVEALDLLKERLSFLKMVLNSKEFVDLWRSVAGGIDHFIFNSIILRNVKFSSMGVIQFRGDMRALFLVFRPFCIRPEAFFPYISDSLKLLSMPWQDVKRLVGEQVRDGEVSSYLHLRELVHVSSRQAEKIFANRKDAG